MTEQWDRLNPERGNLEQLSAFRTRCQNALEVWSHVRQQVTGIVTQLPSPGLWEGQTAQMVGQALEPTIRDAMRMEDSCLQVAEATQTYLRVLGDDLWDRAVMNRLRAKTWEQDTEAYEQKKASTEKALVEAEAKVTALLAAAGEPASVAAHRAVVTELKGKLTALGPVKEDLDTDKRAIERTWDGLAEDRATADAKYVAVLQDYRELIHGALASVPAFSSITAFNRASGITGAFCQADPGGGLVDVQQLAEMNEIALAAWLALPGNQSKLQRTLAAMPPGGVGSWWNQMGQTITKDQSIILGRKQWLLVEAMPGVIGNLQGVTATGRDEANRVMLTRLKDLIEQQKNLPTGKQLPPEAQAMVTNLWKQLYDSKGNRRTATKDIDSVYQLLGFTPFGRNEYRGSMISVGNLDAAQYVTWQVPGLNTNNTQSITEKSVQAGTQWDQQRIEERGSRVAVVSWMGVESAQGAEVLADDKARTMAEQLRRDLWGFQESRAAVGSVPGRTTVVGHSYGSLAVMEAARERVPVNGLVLAGDIGAPEGVSSVQDFQLAPGGRVYRGSYSGDTTAAMGHGVSRGWTDAPGFGAYTYGTDGSSDGLPTRSHGGQTGGKDGVYGYFDKDTEATKNQARISLGKEDEITGRRNPRND